MLRQFWRSLVEGTRSQGNRTTWVVVLGGTLLMTVYVYQGHHSFYTRHLASILFGNDPYNDWYRHLYQNLSALFLLFLIPVLAARYSLGVRLRDQGIGLGDWRFGTKAVVLGALALTPILYLGSFDQALQREYPLTRLAGCGTDLLVLWELTYLLYYIAWEYFFRGFCLFPMAKHWGATLAILYQTVPSTILHIGKPQSEMLAAIAGGVLFGALALRTRSVLYPLLLHWYVGACTDFFCILNHTI